MVKTMVRTTEQEAEFQRSKDKNMPKVNIWATEQCRVIMAALGVAQTKGPLVLHHRYADGSKITVKAGGTGFRIDICVPGRNDRVNQRLYRKTYQKKFTGKLTKIEKKRKFLNKLKTTFVNDATTKAELKFERHHKEKMALEVLLLLKD